MPTYEFWCSKCGKEFEVKRPMADFNKPAVCPDCGTEGERLISNFASTFGAGLKGPEKPPFREKGSKEK
jgi:putative regulatory protein, FmdB family